jgi:class 3 adenylate cyclase/pimeloyl-ACP methyl ester carboxylesterase
MLDMEIRYCTTEDGVRIAYAMQGEGYPLLVPTWTVESLGTRFDHAFIPGFIQAIGRGRTLIHWDPRGRGLSEHLAGQTLDDMVRDTHAVVRAAGFEQYAMLATILGGTSALAYAAAHPEQVSHLVLYDTWAGPFDSTTPEAMRALAAMARADWGMTSQSVADQFIRMDRPELGPPVARSFRESMSGEEFALYLESAFVEPEGAWPLIGGIRTPTLVMHHTGNRMAPFAIAQRMAAEIPNARLLPLEGEVGWSGLADLRPVREAIDRFIPSDSAPPATERAAAREPSSTAAASMAVILFTDIADSTELTERLGDAQFRASSRMLDEGMRAAIRECGGSPVDGKVLGDGVMGVFSSATQAIDAARRCLGLSAESELRLHIGLHAGDVIREEGNVYGGAVNIASRICSLSVNEVLVSATVRDLARTSAGATFADRGEQVLKGIGDPLRVFAVSWQQT